MFANLFRLRRLRLDAHNENHAVEAPLGADQRRARAVATGAALATAIDVSPAAVVGIYDYAHRYGDNPRRRRA